jgi:uncharacterized membrane protein YraQ (UPF0718 family)
LTDLARALELALSMTWEITWALILGFLLSAVVQAVVRRQTVTRLLGDHRPVTLAISAGLAAASSSCSYAAVALARSLFRKGADFTAVIAFQIASTNLVIELGIILILLMGWPFAAGEFISGPIMIGVPALTFRFLLRPQLLHTAHRQADRGIAGSMEGHAAMDMSIGAQGPWWRRLLSGSGLTAVSHTFVMERAAVLRDIAGGLLIAGAVGTWVPQTFWRSSFLVGHPAPAVIWGPLIGPPVAAASFECSIGNVPLAAVLWNGGISFGGVISFIFADLLIPPILVIYRKYHGGRMALFLLATLYIAAVIAGYVTEAVFSALRLIPSTRHALIETAGPSWNYTSVLNPAFLVLAAALVTRFLRSGGRGTLAMIRGAPADHARH